MLTVSSKISYKEALRRPYKRYIPQKNRNKRKTKFVLPKTTMNNLELHFFVASF